MDETSLQFQRCRNVFDSDGAQSAGAEAILSKIDGAVERTYDAGARSAEVKMARSAERWVAWSAGALV